MLKWKILLILILSSAITATFNAQTWLYPQEAPDVRIDKGAKAREALVLLRQAKLDALRIKDHFQHDLLLDQIGAAQARAGDFEAAIETANAAEFPPSETLDEIGTQLAKTNDLARAQALGAKLKQGGLPTILANVVDAQNKREQVDSTFRAAQLISNSEIRSYALEKIALQQAAGGDDAGARKTFSMARETYPSRLLAANGLEMFFLMRDLSKGQTSDVRTKIAELKSPDEKLSARIGLAEILWKKGDRAGANQLLDDALKELPIGSKSDFDRYFIIPIQVRFGRKEAGMLAARALYPEMRVKGYVAVAVTCAETNDNACVEAAVEKMRSAPQVSSERDVSEFGLKLMILNVTAALIDNGQLREADRLLSTLEEQIADASYRMGIEPTLQLQRVLILARGNQFDAARSLALKMRLNSITDLQRGKALRLTALLQTNQKGMAEVLPWAHSLVDGEDRSYALLGIAQALLEMDEVKLGYSAIMVH